MPRLGLAASHFHIYIMEVSHGRALPFAPGSPLLSSKASALRMLLELIKPAALPGTAHQFFIQFDVHKPHSSFCRVDPRRGEQLRLGNPLVSHLPRCRVKDDYIRVAADKSVRVQVH